MIEVPKRNTTTHTFIIWNFAFNKGDKILRDLSLFKTQQLKPHQQFQSGEKFLTRLELKRQWREMAREAKI
jgi:hypothetical protein